MRLPRRCVHFSSFSGGNDRGGKCAVSGRDKLRPPSTPTKLATRPGLVPLHASMPKVQGSGCCVIFALRAFTQPRDRPNVQHFSAFNFSNLNFVDFAIDCANKCMGIPLIPSLSVNLGKRWGSLLYFTAWQMRES